MVAVVWGGGGLFRDGGGAEILEVRIEAHAITTGSRVKMLKADLVRGNFIIYRILNAVGLRNVYFVHIFFPLYILLMMSSVALA